MILCSWPLPFRGCAASETRCHLPGAVGQGYSDVIILRSWTAAKRVPSTWRGRATHKAASSSGCGSWDGWLRVNDSLTPGCALCHFCLLPNRTCPHGCGRKNSAVCGEACDATRNRFHRPDASQTHGRGATEATVRIAAHRSASHGASLAAETRLRRKSREQPVLGLCSQGQQRAACFKARLVFPWCGRCTDVVQWVRGRRRRNFREWLVDKAHQKGGEGANGRDATNRGLHCQPRPTCLGLI